MYSNGSILSKVKVPKSLFVLSSNSAATFNFLLTLIVYFVFMFFCRVTFGVHLLLMLFPILCLIIFNIGMSYILSALFVFFRDMQYLYQIFNMLLMYMSAIFYTIDHYSYTIQCLFLANPVYLFIRYFRKIVIEATIPTLWFHLLMLADVLFVLMIGCWMYKKYNHRFLYYI